jgi:cellulose biosynthesis protein BcsQ
MAEVAELPKTGNDLHLLQVFARHGSILRSMVVAVTSREPLGRCRGQPAIGRTTVSVEKVPYIVFVGSQRGGSARTTAALALAWLWGHIGRDVAVVDADPVEPGLALPPGAPWAWDRVRFLTGSASPEQWLGCDLVLLDGPPLGERAAQPLLRLADAVLVTCNAEPLAVRTMPVALEVVRQAQRTNPALSLLGISVQQFDDSDPLQTRLRGLLWRRYGTYVLEPAVPYQADLTEWLTYPDRPLPDGPARDALIRLAARFEPALGAAGAMAWLASSASPTADALRVLTVPAAENV